ncbi:hypothetical protein B9G54_01915 [Alloscardovia macacae]|uniref:Smf/DprA SLOG domain-containing protein n=2 Tax=Alloscardovia macacae TaxID=1160091 RepID=A0A1Y2SZC7_9BIFI|nr:DNA-processing protein DprA [Alloscardovia macacae]OTA27332.1 hypothetical protein B9G54_01915 [Alloscardovia macacae]OTA29341.1 hypothetical protein B9T39_04110 [Alloscardovia macacae]
MTGEYVFPDEDAALLALLRIKNTEQTWASIAGDVLLEKSASRLLAHTLDPSIPLQEVELYSPGYIQEGLFLDEDSQREIEREYDKACSDLRKWADQGLDFVSILSDRYPQQLASVHDAPPFLFASGILYPQDRGVSVVGSRQCTPAAAAFARDVTHMLVAQNLSVIAGLAEGIDAVAHRTALDDGGRTVACIGTGINLVYPPSHRDLQNEIEQKGLVLSQFYPDTEPTKQTFPLRNAVMSGYGIASIIVEASEYSGTRSQARQAQEQGRPIILHESVVEGTQWAKKYVQNGVPAPGVFVVRTVQDVEECLERILSVYERDIDALMQQMEGMSHG